MMTLRTRIFVVASLVVVSFSSVLAVIMLMSKKKPAGTGPVATTTLGGSGTTAPNYDGTLPTLPPGSNSPRTTAPAKTLTPLEIEQNGVKQLAKVFVERYATYSNQNDYANIRDVEGIVTQTLWKRLSARLTAAQTGGEFVGATVEAISVELGKWESGKASVTVKTRKDEEKNGQMNQVYENYTVSLVKNGTAWLVDSFTLEK